MIGLKYIVWNPCIRKGVFDIIENVKPLSGWIFFLFWNFYCNIRPNNRVLFQKCNTAIFLIAVFDLIWHQGGVFLELHDPKIHHYLENKLHLKYGGSL